MSSHFTKKQVNVRGVSSVSELTFVEADVFHKLTVDFMTPRQIAVSRGVGVSAVSNIIKKLRIKGFINRAYQKVNQKGGTTSLFSERKGWRLHGEQWRLKILYRSDGFVKVLRKCNVLQLDNCSVKLWRDVIEVYSDCEFWGGSPEKATFESFKFFDRLFRRLEVRLGVVLIKPGCVSLKRVKAHYADTNSVVARDYLDRGDWLRVYAREDGKLAFLVDDSKGLAEFEAVHPVSSELDAGRVNDFLTDLRENDSLSLSDLSRLMADTIKQVNGISHGLKSVVMFIDASLDKREEEEVLSERPSYWG